MTMTIHHEDKALAVLIDFVFELEPEGFKIEKVFAADFGVRKCAVGGDRDHHVVCVAAPDGVLPISGSSS